MKKSFSLSTLLTIAFMSISIITLILTIYAIDKLNLVGEYFDKAYHNSILPYREWEEIDRNFMEMEILLNRHIVEIEIKKHTKIEKVFFEIQKNTKEILNRVISNEIIKLESRSIENEYEKDIDYSKIDISLEKTSKLLAILKIHWDEFEKVTNTIINLSNDYMKEDASNILNIEDGHKNFVIFRNITRELLSRMGQNIEYYNKESKLLRDSSEIYLIIGAIIAILLSLMIGFIFSKLITKNIITLQNGLISFFEYVNRRQEKSKKIEINSIDEFIKIAQAVNSSIDTISKSIEDDNRVILAIANENYQLRVSEKGKFDTISRSINQMIEILKKNKEKNRNENWLKDGYSILAKRLSEKKDLIEISNEIVETISEYLNAGIGALYILKDDKVLELYGTYAFIEREDLSAKYELGKGVVGQVGRSKKPILLTDIKKSQAVIQSATNVSAPFNTYTFPLIYENNLIAVVEIGSFKQFSNLELEFLNSASTISARYIFASMQDEALKEALKESEEANIELQRQSEKLQETNTQMEEQQVKIEEANTQLEEQQQQLMLQANELKQKNIILEDSKAEIDKRAKELEQISKYKSEFLANMSHELRTPLNSVILLSNLLSKNKNAHLDDNELKKAKLINQSGEELLRLINDILDLSKVESGKMQLIVDKFKSSNIIEEFRDMFLSIAEEKNLEFKTIDELKENIYTDKNRLYQIIRNLLSNSFKFTKDGNITLRVFKSDRVDKRVGITISDSGIGIPKDKQKLIFEAFHQVDGSISREYGGTGLGLSISRELTKLLGGEIDLASSEGKGSEFTILLPNLTYDKKEIKEDKPKEVNRELKDDRKSIDSSDRKFLIIEDDENFVEILKEKIKERGEKVLIALSGKDGLELAKEYIPNGIILDLGLPDMDGSELIRELKANDITKNIPIHIISGRQKDIKYIKLGAIGYLQKPINESDIDSVLNKLILTKDIKNLLIVEDDLIQREAIVELLKDKNIETIGVSTSKEAISEINRGLYNALILDLNLSEGSGYDVCEYIKDNSIELPIIIYTAKDLSENDIDKLQKYTDSIIVKSANSEDRLLEELEIFLYSNKKEKLKTTTTLNQNIDLKDKKILIVDDDIRNIYILSSALEELEANIFHAKNGVEALEILRQNSDMDIILMDIMMPVMNGYEAIKAIREDFNLKDIPIITVTAKAMPEDRVKSIEVGANDYISKPINIDMLIGMIKSWISKKFEV